MKGRADWLEKGERCWVCDEKSAEQPYRKAVVESIGAVKSVCRFEDGHTEELKNEALEPRTASTALHQDLMEVDKLNNAELLYNLRANFQAQNIYTYVGANLLVVNPYKLYPELYSQQLQHFYIEKVAGKQPDQRLPPHVYAVACQAIRNLQTNQRSQSVLISGQSGAGKTQANKQVLRLIAKYYGVGHHGIQDKVPDEAMKIVACNPLLEAFGNAKTIRNDNSSRFGKFIEMQINNASRTIHQACIHNYLLEKSRLISQFEGERNFHIFYYFLKGTETGALLKYGITAGAKLDDFEYLKGTQFLHADDRMLAEVRSSLKILPYADAEEAVWRVVAAILHLGNVHFREVAGFKSELTTADSLKHVCRLLELPEEVFKNSLTTYRIKVSSESLDKHFTVNEIKQIRDSLAKALYQRLFAWLVSALNKSLQSQVVIPEKQRRALLSIGLLDIYGFEVLRVNSFEQLCINFTNERLHQLYLADMFKSERSVFQAEGLSDYVQVIPFKDNEQLLDMLDSNSLSVFNLLDEWCSVASPDEQSFLTKVRFQHKKNEYFPQVNLNTTTSSLFIRHTPREVEYNVTLFKEKNKNQLRDDVHAVLRESKLWLVQALFPPEDKDSHPLLSSNASKMKKFIGSKFRFEINKLTSELQSQSELHFIRCVKSNGNKEPQFLDERVVLEQIRYLSVLESIQMRRKSYCVRIPYQRFCERFYWYVYLLGDKLSAKELTMKTMKTYFSSLGKEDILFGNSKVFMRDYVEYRLNLAYRKRLAYLRICAHRVATAFIRGRYNRRQREKRTAQRTIGNFLNSIRCINYLAKLKKAVRTIERYWLSKITAEDKKRRRYQIIALQTYFRRTLEYRRRARKLTAVGVIERFYKKHLLRERMMKYLRVQLAIKDVLVNTINSVAESRVFLLEKYLRTAACMIKNRDRIRQSIRNEMQSLRHVNSRTIEKYSKGAVLAAKYGRFMKAVLWMQRQYRTKVCRRSFLSLRNSIIRIQRAYREFYFRKVQSHRIFTKFFENYNRQLIAYNEEVRSALFGSRKSKQDQQTYVQDIIKAYIGKYHTKMALFYYIVDFEAHIDITDAYPGQSWLENYLKLYRQGFEKYAPVQQLQVGETLTVAATSNRLYSWGSLVEPHGDKLTAVHYKGVISSYRLKKDTLEINQVDPVVRQSTSKKSFCLSKHCLTQLIKENPIPVQMPKVDQRKVLEISCGNAHTICRTSTRHVFTWGLGVNGQLGHGQFYSQDKPRCVEFFSSSSHVVEAIQVAATYCSSVVLLSNRKVFWFGRNGTLLDVPHPVELNLQQKGRVVSNPQLTTPIKLVVSWSKTMSIVGLTLLSYNGVLENNLTLRTKLINLIIGKWHSSGIQLINPPYTHNIANYLSESSIKLPATKQPSEMESRKALRDLQEEIKSVLRDDSMQISFSFDNPIFK